MRLYTRYLKFYELFCQKICCAIIQSVWNILFVYITMAIWISRLYAAQRKGFTEKKKSSSCTYCTFWMIHTAKTFIFCGIFLVWKYLSMNWCNNNGNSIYNVCAVLEKYFHFSMCSHHSYRAFLLYCRGCEKLLRGNFLFYGCNNIGRIMITHPSWGLEITFHIWNFSKTYILLLIKLHMKISSE